MATIARRKRPASVVVLAVFQFIVGGVGIVYELAKGGFTLMFLLNPSMLKAAEANNPVIGITADVPYFFQGQVAASLFGLILSVVLIADGVGLLMLRRWAYNLGIVYGWLSIAYQVVWMAYLLMVAMPVILAGVENMPVPAQVSGTPAQAETYRNIMKGAEIFDISTTAVGLTYPIFVLILLAVARKAFRRPQPSEADAAFAGDEGDETGIRQGPDVGYTDLPPGYGSPPDDRIGPAR